MYIPEGSGEQDFNGRKLVVGRLGRLELYLSIVWKYRRYLFAIGSYRQSDEHWWQRRVWFRWISWNTKLLDFDEALYDPYTPDVWYSDGSVHGEAPGYYHRDECEFAHGPFKTREEAHAALLKYCAAL